MQSTRNSGSNSNLSSTGTNENVYSVRADIWASYDGDQKQLYNQIMRTELQRKDELLQNIDSECRDTVREHFDNILSSVIQSVIRHTDLALA